MLLTSDAIGLALRAVAGKHHEPDLHMQQHNASAQRFEPRASLNNAWWTGQWNCATASSDVMPCGDAGHGQVRALTA